MSQYDELEQYLRQSEPEKHSRGVAWATAIGLQEVDGLKTSAYLRDTARRNIEGEITIHQAQELIRAYYVSKDVRQNDAENYEEADKVSANIARLLGEQAFVFSPAGLISVHRRVFEGVYKHAGTIRDYNITKTEWVLNGDTVLYAPATEIMPSLEYDFGEEKKFSYKGVSIEQMIEHISHFISDIWQIHPFCEGNTRTTAVFLIKYLRSLGYKVNNEPFVENSWYFRNALVRANVKNPAKGIEQTSLFLIRFFENLLKGTNHELKNRFMHVDYKKEDRPSDQATDQATMQVLRLVTTLVAGPLSREEIMQHLGLKHLPSFRKNYIRPALDGGFIEMTIPDNPTDSRQKYRLTDKGMKLAITI